MTECNICHKKYDKHECPKCGKEFEYHFGHNVNCQEGGDSWLWCPHCHEEIWSY